MSEAGREASTPAPELSDVATQAAAFASRVVAQESEAAAAQTQQPARAAARDQQPPGPPPVPDGAQLLDGRCVVREDSPSFELLSEATAYNKRGTPAAFKFPAFFKIDQRPGGQPVTATVPVVALWVAARAVGGLHVVLRRGTLFELVLGIPGQQNFPQALVKELTNRVNTWLLPIYGYSEDEELSGWLRQRCLVSRVGPALEAGVAQGWLTREDGTIKLTAAEPTREQVLLAMQAHHITLPRYDLVVLGNTLLYVEHFYAAVYAEGGGLKVRGQPGTVQLTL
eukprot:scaffold13.g371.t1